MKKKNTEIIYSDNDIIVVNKPAGIAVTKDRTGARQLVDVLGESLGHEETKKLRLVHRLDKDTSGVMILARNIETQRILTSCFENRKVKKTYLALVSGVITSQKGRIEGFITEDHGKPGKMSAGTKKGKDAVTEWRLLADFGSIALLAVYPLTGRRHQIRVQLASIGLPLVIDPIYSSSRALFLSDFKQDYRLAKDKSEKPLINRLTLHAYQIELPDIQANHPGIFVAGLDKKFAVAIKMLCKYNSKGPDAFLNPEDFTKIINAEKIN